MLANAHAQTSVDPELTAAVKAFEAAMAEKNLEAALGAWDFATEFDRAAEEANLRGVFSYDQVTFTSGPPGLSASGNAGATLSTLALITEPRGAIEQWGLRWDRTPQGWRITDKRGYGGIDGLVHLTLQNQGYIANGQTIELEDFTLSMTDGTFFLNTEDAGPTSLVFVGKGRVLFRPRPPTERGQMKLFTKSEELNDEVSVALLRLHPADLYRTLKPGSFVDDPKSDQRVGKAMEFFEEHKADAFVLDAAVTGAPWWLLPGLGDSAIVFETRHNGLLTFSLNSFEDEGVSLFSRKNRRQISVYPRSVARDQAWKTDSAIDLLHHDLALTLDPDTFEITGRDTLTLNILAPLASFRLRLDDELKVRSITSDEGGSHLFFRVRGQNSLLVSMGSLSNHLGPLRLKVEYSGHIPAGTVESEILQIGLRFTGDDLPFLEPALIYSRRHAFYPEVGGEDYATSRMAVTVPAEWSVVSGGVRGETTEGGTRTVTYEQATEAKYLAFMASRLTPVASERSEALSFDAYAQPRSRGEASRLVDELKSAVDYYSRLFGPLPYTPLNMAVVEAPIPGGHSPPGLLIVQQRPPMMGGGLKDDPASFYDIPGFFLAHELAHQWWGHGVTPSSYRDRWVSEGFAQYAAALWTRESLGEESFTRVLKKMVSWARRLGEAGPVDLGNRVGHIQNNAQAHRAVVYDKGALVLDMVRRLVGEEAFARGLRKLQAEHPFAKVDTETVRRAFEAEGSLDLDALWEVFVRNTALPTMRLVRLATGLEIVVDGYAGPLPVEVRVGDERRKLIVSGRAKIPGVLPGMKVELDPDEISLVREGR